MNRLFLTLAQLSKDDVNLPNKAGGLTNTSVQGALELVFGVAGAIALLIITIAAFQYVVSMGDPQSTAKAKNAIIYALIGLVVCVLAFSLVRFVVGRI